MLPPKSPTTQQTLPPSISGQSSQGTNPFATSQRITSGTQAMSPPISQTQSFSSQTSSTVPSTYPTPFQNPSQTSFQAPSSQPLFQQQNQSQPAFQQSQPAFQVPTTTGTNPFSRTQSVPNQQRLTPQVTGSNPFRKSMLSGSNIPNGWSQ